MINDNFSVKGDVHVTVYDENGNIKEERDILNLVVTTGKKFLANKLAAPAQLIWNSAVTLAQQFYYNGYLYTVTAAGTLPVTPASLTTTLTASTTLSGGVVLKCDADLTTDGVAIKYMAIGTSSTTPTVSDSSLGSQLANRQPVSVSYTSGSGVAAKVVYSASFPGSTFVSTAVTEAGLFCSSTGGILVCRTIFGSFPILSSDSIGISWTLSIL